MDVTVLESDLELAIKQVLSNLNGIEKLFENQKIILRLLVDKNNIIFTSPTNSGKSLPPVILPEVLKVLSNMGYNYPKNPKVLFITALNSIQSSLRSSLKNLGLKCGIITKSSAESLIPCSDVGVLFIGPEVMQIPTVIKALVDQRASFVCKVIDEAHLGK